MGSPFPRTTIDVGAVVKWLLGIVVAIGAVLGAASYFQGVAGAEDVDRLDRNVEQVRSEVHVFGARTYENERRIGIAETKLDERLGTLQKSVDWLVTIQREQAEHGLRRALRENPPPERADQEE